MGYKFRNKQCKRILAVRVFAFLVLSLGAWGTAVSDECSFAPLSDIPLDAKVGAAPGIIMFLIDDSGSMDFATMIENVAYDGINFYYSGGQFFPPGGSRVAYVFDNPGDQVYPDRDLDGDEHLYWQIQYSGINKMYYNPESTYTPWPKWDTIAGANYTDPHPDTTDLDMNPDVARSNPMNASNTFDLNGDFYTFGESEIDTEWVVDNADAIIDNAELEVLAEIVITPCDDGPDRFFSKSTRNGGEWTNKGCDSGCEAGWRSTNDGEGYYTAQWQANQVSPNAGYAVYVKWHAHAERGEDIPYTIEHSLGNDVPKIYEVDQENNGCTWIRLGGDTAVFKFGTGQAVVKIDDYHVTSAGEGQASNEVSAVSIKLKCVENCSDSPFQASGPYDTDSGWYEDDDDDDCLDENYSNSGSNRSNLRTEQAGDYTATWTATGLDPAKKYNVYAWWNNSSERSDAVEYKIYNDTTLAATAVKSQRAANDAEPQLLAEEMTFSSGTGVVKLDLSLTENDIDNSDDGGEVCADAVAFVPTPETGGMPSAIKRAHYFVKNQNGVFLVNLEGDADSGDFHYYKMVDADNDGKIDTDNGLVELTTADEITNAGLNWIEEKRSYKEERINFANWYSFYRTRELTAKNAIARVITGMQNVFIGFNSINDDLGQQAIPVNVTHNGVTADETDNLLGTLYKDWNSSGGTPLRSGLDEVGKYFSGTTGSDGITNSIYEFDDGDPETDDDYTTWDYYPFFPPEGGNCELAFCIAMTDGFWNKEYSGVGDADADDPDNEFDNDIYHGSDSNTLADIAMYYYKNDLNSKLANNVPTTTLDKASHQHMVTYGVSFGANGSLDPDVFTCDDTTSTCADNTTCTEAAPCNCCPDWPAPGSDESPGKIDDLYHASVNGRGQFINAGTPDELITAMDELQNLIQSRLGSAAAAATNTIQILSGTKIYQGTYHSSSWSGDLIQYSVDSDTGAIGDVDWRASEKLADISHDQRIIYTYNGTQGVPFKSDQDVLPDDPYTDELVDYLRGDHDNNKNNGGNFRIRSGKLGDIVHSAPVVFGDRIFVGANDGMLHAFNKEDGKELFAYVPKIFIDSGTLDDLASTDYTHLFYVDNTVTVRQISTATTLLVGGLRNGGKGYFCLNINNAAFTTPATPSDSDASNVVKWEYSASAQSDNDLGYSYSQAYIIKTNDPDIGWAVVFGNGYESVGGKAMVYLIDVNDTTGAFISLTKFDTLAGTCNGMSTPSPVDVNYDGKTDYIYAGDLKGNLWKIDISSDNDSNWGFAYADGATPKPLISVQHKVEVGDTLVDREQPITVQPNITKMECDSDQKGYFVVFGTGRYIGTNDPSNTDQQTFYGVWDWQDEFIDPEPASFPAPQTTVSKKAYLGIFNVSDATPKLKIDEDTDTLASAADNLTLVQQSISKTISGYRVMSDNYDEGVPWFDAPSGDADTDTDFAGWYFNLEDTGARVIQAPLLRPGAGGDVGIVTFVSNVPSDSDCGGTAGYSWLYQLSTCNGGMTSNSQFDTTGDGVVDDDDKLDDTPNDDNPPDKSPSADYFDDMLYRPIQVGPNLYINDSSGDPPNQVKIPDTLEGLYYWRQIEN